MIIETNNKSSIQTNNAPGVQTNNAPSVQINNGSNRLVNRKKVFYILNWTLFGVTIFIFCMLIIISSILFNLLLTNRIGRYDDPQVYAMYVTAITFIIIDLIFMLIWLGLIHALVFINHKHNILVNKKKIYTIINGSFILGFFLLNVIVITLLIVWLGGYADTIDERIGLVIGIGVVEIIKALIMIATLVISIRIIVQNKRGANNYEVK